MRWHPHIKTMSYVVLLVHVIKRAETRIFGVDENSGGGYYLVPRVWRSDHLFSYYIPFRECVRLLRLARRSSALHSALHAGRHVHVHMFRPTLCCRRLNCRTLRSTISMFHRRLI